MADGQKNYENEEGAAQTFWSIVDRISGKGPRKKAGSLLTVGGACDLAIGLLIGDTVGWVVAIIGAAGVATGLVLRFLPSKTVTEEEAKAAVAEVQQLDVDQLTNEKQEQLADMCGISIHELAGKVNLLALTAKQLAYKWGERFGEKYKQLDAQVAKQGRRGLNQNDRQLYTALEYAAALSIKEEVLESVAS